MEIQAALVNNEAEGPSRRGATVAAKSWLFVGKANAPICWKKASNAGGTLRATRSSSALSAARHRRIKVQTSVR
jgi:hypothetical protein